MKKIKEQFRHGDVYFVPISMIPTGAKRVEPDSAGRSILALGESTGHAHVMEDVDLYERDGVLYVKVADPTPVQHIHLPTNAPTKDHGTDVAPPGLYEIRIHQETMPDGVVRPVLD